MAPVTLSVEFRAVGGAGNPADVAEFSDQLRRRVDWVLRPDCRRQRGSTATSDHDGRRLDSGTHLPLLDGLRLTLVSLVTR